MGLPQCKQSNHRFYNVTVLYLLLFRFGIRVASVELGRWSVRNPRTFITENTENTECRGSPCRTPGNQDFHSDFLSRCSSCLARPPYSPFSPYSPFLFANRSFRPPNASDVILLEKTKKFFSAKELDIHGDAVILPVTHKKSYIEKRKNCS